MIQALSSKSARLLLAAAILASCVGCDQATKQIATRTLRGAEPRSYLSDLVRLEYSLNPGGFLSLGGAFSPEVRFWMFTVFNMVMLAVVGGALVKHWNVRLAMFVAVVCFMAGGIGNLIDRVMHDGLVTDFIVLGAWPLQTGIFNVADVAITGGALACVLLHYRDDRPRSAAKA